MDQQGLDLTLDRISAAWSLRDVSILSVVSTYPTRHVVMLDSDRGKLAVKVSAGSGTGLRHAADLLSWLNGRGFPHAPGVILTSEGGSVAAWDSHAACALEFIPDQVSPGAGLEPDLWASLGGALARLHCLGRSLVPHLVPVDLALNEVARWADEMPFRSDALRLLEAIGPALSEGTATVVHGEVNSANAAFRSDGTIVLLDWDQAGDARPVVDLGYPLITQFVTVGTHVFHRKAACAFYSAACDIARPEADKVFAAAVLHALRYARFADTDLRWQRICWAVDNKEELCDVIA